MSVTLPLGGGFLLLEEPPPGIATFGGRFNLYAEPGPGIRTFGGDFTLGPEVFSDPDCFLVWGGERVPARMRVTTPTGRYP